jgi:hypothetical protein
MGCGLKYTRRPEEKRRSGCKKPYVKKRDRRKQAHVTKGAGGRGKGRHHFKIVIPNPYPTPLDESP